jgi:hypothetical protein
MPVGIKKDRRTLTVPATVRGIQSRNSFTSFLDDVRQVKQVFKKEAGKEKRRVRISWAQTQPPASTN